MKDDVLLVKQNNTNKFNLVVHSTNYWRQFSSLKEASSDTL